MAHAGGARVALRADRPAVWADRRGLHAGRCRRLLADAAFAAASVTSEIWFGRVDRASQARMSTSSSGAATFSWRRHAADGRGACASLRHQPRPDPVQRGLSCPAPGRTLQYVMYRPAPKIKPKAPHATSPAATAGKPASQPPTPTAASAAAVTRTRIAMAVETGDPCGSDEVTSSSPLTGPAEPFTQTTECGASTGAGIRGPQRQAEGW